MDVSQSPSSLSCEIKIITAKNIELKPTSKLFVRCYLSAGNNQRVKFDSQEISPNYPHSFSWNESFSLDCFGMSKESLNKLMQGSVIFELRSRSTILPVFGRIRKSQLMGKAEIAWKRVNESQNKEIEKWVVMVPKKHDGLMKPPSIQIGMKIESPLAEEEAARRMRRNGVSNKHECECFSCSGGCESCLGFEVLALGVAFEAF